MASPQPQGQPIDPNLNPATTTQEQLEQQRLLQAILMKQGQSEIPVGHSGPFEAVSPWGGVAQMTKALMSGLVGRGTTREELANQGRAATTAVTQPIPGQPQPTPYVPGGAGPQNPSKAVGSTSPAQGPTAQAPAELKQLFAAKEQQYGLPPGYLEGTARIESSFNPRSFNELSRAHGMFQFIPSTAKQYGLHWGVGPGSTGDVVASADAAARFAADNMKHLQSHGINPDAGKLYLAHQQGPAGATALLTHPNAPAGSVVNPRAISANAGNPALPAAYFAAHWASKFPQGQGQQDFISQFPTGAAPQAATQPQGQPVKVASNAPDEITSHYSQADQDYVNQHQAPVKVAGPPMASGAPQAAAVAPGGQPAGTQVAAGQTPTIRPAGPPVPSAPAAPTQVASPSGQSGQTLPPGAFTQRQQMSREQAQKILADPFQPPEIKQWAFNSLYGQYQPVQAMGDFGITNILQPGSGQVTPVAPPPHYGTVSGGEGTSAETPIWTVPPGKTPPGTAYGSFGPGLGSSPTPPAAPGTAAPGVNQPTGPAPSINIGPAVVPGKGSEAEPKTRVAVLETGETGTMNDAGLLGGILNTPAPSAKPDTEAAAPKVGIAPGSRTAQQGVPPIMQSLRDFGLQTRNAKNQQDIERQRRTETNALDLKNYSEAATLNQKNATTASNLIPHIKEAQRILHDPNLKLGPGVDLKLLPDIIKSFMGDSDAGKRLGLNQSFDKLVSGGILDVMRSKLQGLGPVRNTELALLSKAAESTHNNKEANILILDMALKYQDQLSKIGQLTNMYSEGYRPDAKGNMVFVDKLAARSPAELNEITNRYLANNPLYTDEQIFGTDPKTGKPGTAEHPFPGGIMDIFKSAAPGPIGVVPPGYKKLPKRPEIEM